MNFNSRLLCVFPTQLPSAPQIFSGKFYVLSNFPINFSPSFSEKRLHGRGRRPPGNLRTSDEPDLPPSENPDKEPNPGKPPESQATESLSPSLGPSAGGVGDLGDSSVDPGRLLRLKKITQGQAAESLSLSREPSANGGGRPG